jgi:hypothetical protein
MSEDGGVGRGHPVMSALADIEQMLAWCVEAPLFGLSGGEVEDALVRAHALVARIQGGLMLPLVREAEPGACRRPWMRPTRWRGYGTCFASARPRPSRW